MSLIFVAIIASASDGKIGTYDVAENLPASAQVVNIGFYPISVYQLDMPSNTYYIDTYVWMRWRGDIDPTSTIEFTNMVEEWGKQQENLLEEPKVLADGSNYQIMRVEGRFVQPFSLVDFPLDRQQLSIIIEDTTNGVDTVSYVIDTDSSGIGESLDVPGWLNDGWSAQSLVHDYGTNFGEEETPSSYSALKFSIDISRPLSYFIWALLLPLFIVLAAALSALLIKPQEHDVRTALPAGALLTAIFLQKSYSEDLPELDYLIIMDKIYLVAYVLIVGTLVRSIIAYKKVSDAGGDDHAVIRSVHATDRKILIAKVVIFVIAILAISTAR